MLFLSKIVSQYFLIVWFRRASIALRISSINTSRKSIPPRVHKSRNHGGIDDDDIIPIVIIVTVVLLFYWSHIPTIIRLCRPEMRLLFLCGDCKIKIIQPIYITMNSFKPVLFGLRAHTIILSMSTHIYVYWIIQAFILAVRIVKCVTHIFGHKFSCEKKSNKKGAKIALYVLRIGTYDSIQLKREKKKSTQDEWIKNL